MCQAQYFDQRQFSWQGRNLLMVTYLQPYYGNSYINTYCYTCILHQGLWSWQTLKFLGVKESTCFLKILVCNEA
jgi:hypothetical protein